MGVYGTRWVLEHGVAGRLNVFAEPTGCRAIDTCTASMTLCVEVAGEDSTDDFPAAGHNATVALGAIAVELAHVLDAARPALKGTVAGLHTGEAHNRVYGSGRLLVNVAYADPEAAAAGVERLERAPAAARARLERELGGGELVRRLLDDWDDVVTAGWVKRGLPTLANRDAEMERVMAAAGLPRAPEHEQGALTCDAIWAGAPGRYVAVCGPGRLDANGAHTDREHVALAELEDYATRVRDLVVAFADHVAREEA